MPDAIGLSPDDRRRILTLLRSTDADLSARYEAAERDREHGLDVARSLLLGTHVQTFAEEFRVVMTQHATLGERMAEALRLDAEARLKAQQNVERRFAALWGPRGTVIALVTLFVTNAVAVIGTLWATGAAAAAAAAPGH